MATIDTTPSSPTTTEHIIVDAPGPDVDPDMVPDKISAYYSLAFPNFTYYLQTLTVTIGRRPARTGSASSSDSVQIDVDLGPLKSVSRLHAKIEYEEDNERFVLVVLGRNGAWVDGIWSGSGSRVPLSARSQIQIATRIFHFVLPPPPAPEDSPTPSSPSSTTRHLSPSIDITSLSPDSSLPSPPPSGIDASPQQKEAAIAPKSGPKTNNKKRKKPDPEVPRPLPADMPPRPQFTYAQLCYRAIKWLDGKATLQEICHWISDNHDWYRYNEGSGWENSVRHNLSSNRAFKKMERCAGERGKGFFWSVDPKFEHIFESQEAKLASASTNKDGGKGKPKNQKGGSSFLDPPLKRSVKGEGKQPLPPPLTSTPLPAFTTAPLQPAINLRTPVSPPSSGDSFITAKSEPFPAVIPPAPTLHASTGSSAQILQSVPSAGNDSSPIATTSNSALPSIPPDMIVPIVIGPMPSPSTAPASTDNTSGASPHLATPPIALRGDTIILNPTIFSGLTPAQLKELEALGARKAIDILQGYIVRFLKERIKTEGARGRGKARSKRGRAGGPRDKAAKEDGTGAASSGAEGPSKAGDTASGQGRGSVPTAPKTKPRVAITSGPFTTTPLPPRPQPQQQHTPNSFYPPPAAAPPQGLVVYQTGGPPVPSIVDIKPPVPVRVASPPPMAHLASPVPTPPPTAPGTGIDQDGPAFKKRRVDAMHVAA